MGKRTLFIVWGLLFAVCSPIFSQKIVETGKIVETDYFEKNKELGGEVVIKKMEKVARNGKASTVFEVIAPKAGSYYASFWMIPSKQKDGSYTSYMVNVNDSKELIALKPVAGDWQCLALPGNGKISLRQGSNIISVSCQLPEIPNVEHVKIAATPTKALMDIKPYSSYKKKLGKQKYLSEELAGARVEFVRDTLTLRRSGRLASAAEAPLYEYDYRLNVPLKYTFYTTLYFYAGDTASITTSSAKYFTHVLEFFNRSLPASYSWSDRSRNGVASMDLVIPQSGYYIVRVRSFINGASGVCDVNINDRYTYDEVPVYSYGVRCEQGTNMVYNTFTCYNNGDPRLWIEEGEVAPGVISAINDDFTQSGGDFNWGANSRLRMQYTRPVHSVLLSAYSSYVPNGQCDLYMKCQNAGTDPSFPNLKDLDAIMSSSSSSTYNCISWSGGITSYWEWPPYNGSAFYSPNALTAFDNFYASRGLTRSGATESTSVVDLWANVSGGVRDYTHGSVRKGADGNAHGYAWESKCGAWKRIFHPRQALSGPLYGQVVEYYVKSSSYRYATLAEEIAEGVSRIVYVDFDDDERALISKKVGLVSPKIASQFQTLYANWENVVNNSVLSNPDQIADCKEYKELLAYCQSNKELVYAAFEKLEKGNGLASTKLVGDLTLSKYSSVMDKVRADVIALEKKSAIKTFSPIKSNFTSYVKRILSQETPTLRSGKIADEDELAGVSYSNFKEFSISSSSEGLTVDFSLNDPATVTLNLIDLEGNIVNVALNEKALENGDYSYSLSADKNRVYLVQLVIDGHVNVKKVVVK